MPGLQRKIFFTLPFDDDSEAGKLIEFVMNALPQLKPDDIIGAYEDKTTTAYRRVIVMIVHRPEPPEELEHDLMRAAEYSLNVRAVDDDHSTLIEVRS